MAIVFPSDNDFIPLTRDGQVYENPPFNENPASVDMVGTSNYPAIYFATGLTHVFFRFRLRDTPALGGGFQNNAWIILVDTDMDLANSYEWEIALRGNSNDIVLMQNIIKNSPSPGFGDLSEGVPMSFPIVAYDIARTIPSDSMIGGVQNYFLDMAIDLISFKSILGITDTSLLRFNYLTATNENNFNKDKMCLDINFDNCFSDYFTLSTILSGSLINKEEGTPICNAFVQLIKNSDVLYETYTDALGKYIFKDIEPGDYIIKIWKCCYLPLCNCTEVTIYNNKNTIYNFSLAPDCVCNIKCNIIEIEKELAKEKERVYRLITDYLITVNFNVDNIWQYTQLICILNSGTGELDCCISKVLDNLTTCQECD